MKTTIEITIDGTGVDDKVVREAVRGLCEVLDVFRSVGQCMDGNIMEYVVYDDLAREWQVPPMPSAANAVSYPEHMRSVIGSIGNQMCGIWYPEPRK